MALQFVLGSSGSGKTEYIYERLVRQAGEHPKKNYLVIVPEQFTMQTQQKLVELAPNHAIMNIDVLSFKRLAYRVFDDMGMQDIQVLEETGKNLVLRRLAQEQEETLTVLRANMNRMGYIGEVKSMISELVQRAAVFHHAPDNLVHGLVDDELLAVRERHDRIRRLLDRLDDFRIEHELTFLVRLGIEFRQLDQSIISRIPC